MARQLQTGRQGFQLQPEIRHLGQRDQSDQIHGHDQHAADQLRHQLLRRHDAGRVVGLHLQRTVPEQRRGANLRRLLEVRAEQDRMAEGRPEIRRPQRRRPHRQRLQPAGRPRRPVDHRQHLAPLLLQPRRGCTLERHRPLDGLARRRPPRLVSRQRVGLLLGQYGRPYSIALPWHNDRYTDANQTPTPTGRV